MLMLSTAGFSSQPNLYIEQLSITNHTRIYTSTRIAISFTILSHIGSITISYILYIYMAMAVKSLKNTKLILFAKSTYSF